MPVSEHEPNAKPLPVSTETYKLASENHIHENRFVPPTDGELGLPSPAVSEVDARYTHAVYDTLDAPESPITSPHDAKLESWFVPITVPLDDGVIVGLAVKVDAFPLAKSMSFAP